MNEWNPFAILDGPDIYESSNGMIFDVSTDEGKCQAVRHELSLNSDDMRACGRSVAPHWGDQNDIAVLEDLLNIGIIIFWKNDISIIIRYRD